MIKLTGLWKSKDKNGNTYLCGSLSPISNLIIMPNTFKEDDKAPDYFVYISPKKQKKDSYKNNETAPSYDL